jgi:hypothetical protein
VNEIKDISSVKYSRFLFSAKDNFLTGDSNLECAINYFIQVPLNINDKLYEFHTLLIDLNKTEKDIWDAIYHRTQTEINSFIKNTDYTHELITDLSPENLKTFIRYYNNFAQAKKIRRAEKQRLAAYNKASLLFVSYIKYKKDFVCINFYRVNTNRAANIHSFSFHDSSTDQLSKSFLGKARRALHWLDILEFKKMNVRYYDFCGWYNGNDNPELLNINHFKEQFTSSKIVEYSGVIYKNPLLNILKKISDFGK